MIGRYNFCTMFKISSGVSSDKIRHGSLFFKPGEERGEEFLNRFAAQGADLVVQGALVQYKVVRMGKRMRIWRHTAKVNLVQKMTVHINSQVFLEAILKRTRHGHVDVPLWKVFK